MSDRVEQLSRVGQTAIRGIPGGLIAPTVNRMGASIVVDQLLQLAMDGHTYHAQLGDALTKLVLVETAYDEDQPQFALRVPAGTVVIPLSLVVNHEIQSSTMTHVVWSTTTNDIGNSATSNALTISSMRTDAVYTSRCFARSLYTADAVAATGLIEFARWIDPFAVVSTGRLARYEWNIRTAAAIPILVGPATLQLHDIGAADAEGYMEAVWAELDKTALETP